MSDPTVETKALEMGWKPQENFKGDPDKWVDAETYVRKGEEYLPFIRAENRRLKSEIDGMKGQLTEAQETIKAAQESVEGMKEFYTEETKRRVEEARKDVVTQIKEAREAGDVEAEAELLGQLGEIDAATREAKKVKAAPPTPTPAPKPVVDPEFLVWQQTNDWYGKDRRKTMLALGIAEEVQKHPDTKDLRGKPFYEEVARQVDEYLGIRQPTKVEEGSGGSGGGSGRGDAGKTYADLPSDAKAACDRLASKVVGKGKAHADAASWRKAYAIQYFEE